MATNNKTTNKTKNQKNTQHNSKNSKGASSSRDTSHRLNNATNSSKSSNSSKRTNTYSKQNYEYDDTRRREVLLFVDLAIAIFWFCSNLGWCGVVGNIFSKFIFGLTGTVAYVLPLYFFASRAYLLANGPKRWLVKKVLCFGLFIIAASFIFQLISGVDGVTIKELYSAGSEKKAGGGVILGGLLALLYKLIGITGSIIVIVLITIIAIVVALNFSIVKAIKHIIENNYYMVEDDDYDEYEPTYYEAQGTSTNNKKNKKIRNKSRNKGIDVLSSIKVLEPSVLDTKASTTENNKVIEEEVHELKPIKEETLDFFDSSEFEGIDIFNEKPTEIEPVKRRKKTKETNKEMLQELDNVTNEIGNSINTASSINNNVNNSISEINIISNLKKPKNTNNTNNPNNNTKANDISNNNDISVDNKLSDLSEKDVEIVKEYQFPPIELLKSGNSSNKGSAESSVKETAYKLKKTLENFGVNVAITDYSCGPSVTRYELQPEQGVKVSKIVNLADDIKLNLAAADIRIEAPIPGKAAIGIEVPNKETTSVYFRDLLESENFKKASSLISFAVGKDISGQVIVADIAKMPHLLIAGSTGSGKSVCINTLIMSILYKANPNDVKLIMVDPKQVELSIYNGIPHMLIPVVTDPKKAAGALNWAVMEMTNRYQLFAQYNVRNLQGYNDKVKNVTGKEEGNEELKKLPQIVIIVDELADLMMVAHGEVEDAIVRLSQLARAAGIHLVIATQRPSVDVITGLIKANVPSRIAMAVSSGVDSRTILDMNGAEKLLGKGDMLFYPTGYPKPVRVQGAFLSDDEIADVVDFLKNENNEESHYDEKITSHIENSSVGTSKSGAQAESEYDDYFADAGRFIIGKDKASIGMLQRVYKIGFNRAARIMDQLSDAGVVGPEEGTKPRKVLMTMEEFENYVEEYL